MAITGAGADSVARSMVVSSMIELELEDESGRSEKNGVEILVRRGESVKIGLVSLN